MLISEYPSVLEVLPELLMMNPLKVFAGMLIVMKLCIILCLIFLAIVLFTRKSQPTAARAFGWFALFFGGLGAAYGLYVSAQASKMMDHPPALVILMPGYYECFWCFLVGLVVFGISRWGSKSA